MVLCPCGVTDSANGAVGRRPSQIPTSRNRTPDSRFLNSHQLFPSGLCGSSSACENNNEVIDPKLAVTSQPQPTESRDEEKTTLTPANLLSKLPKFTSGGTKKLSNLPVSIPRLGSEEVDDKPKIEDDKVSSSLALSGHSCKYVGTKPVKSNVLAIQPVLQNPNRHLAGITTIPITHYDNETGISIYVNPNDSIDYKNLNSLTHQDKNRTRYTSQRSLTDDGFKNSSSDINSTICAESEQKRQPRARPRSECGKRPIPQPEDIKEEPTAESPKTRRKVFKRTVFNCESNRKNDVFQKGNFKITPHRPPSLKHQNKKFKDEPNYPPITPDSGISHRVQGALVWVSDALKFNTMKRVSKSRTKSPRVPKIPDDNEKNNESENKKIKEEKDTTKSRLYPIKVKNTKKNKKPPIIPSSNLPEIHPDPKKSVENKLPPKYNRKLKFKKKSSKNKTENCEIHQKSENEATSRKPPDNRVQSRTSETIKLTSKFSSQTTSNGPSQSASITPLSMAMINDDSLVPFRGDLNQVMNDSQNLSSSEEDLLRKNETQSIITDDVFGQSRFHSDQNDLLTSSMDRSLQMTDSIYSSSITSSISSIPNPSELANNWNMNPELKESPIQRRRKIKKSLGSRGSLNFYPVYQNCKAPSRQCSLEENTQSLTDDEYEKRASVYSLPANLNTAEPEWRHWGPLYSCMSSPDEGFGASDSFSSIPADVKSDSEYNNFPIDNRFNENFKFISSFNRMKSLSCTNCSRPQKEDMFDKIEVNCRVPSMKALNKPRVYEYRTRENFRQLHRLSQCSEASEYMEMDMLDGSNKMTNPDSLNPRSINYFETYWDYWLAKNKLRNMIQRYPENNNFNPRPQFCVSNKTARKYSYDPELLLENSNFNMKQFQTNYSSSRNTPSVDDINDISYKKFHMVKNHTHYARQENGYFSEPEFINNEKRTKPNYNQVYHRTDSFDDDSRPSFIPFKYCEIKEDNSDTRQLPSPSKSLQNYRMDRHYNSINQSMDSVHDDVQLGELRNKQYQPNTFEQQHWPYVIPNPKRIPQGVPIPDSNEKDTSNQGFFSRNRLSSFIWRSKKSVSAKPTLEKIHEKGTKIPKFVPTSTSHNPNEKYPNRVKPEHIKSQLPVLSRKNSASKIYRNSSTNSIAQKTNTKSAQNKNPSTRNNDGQRIISSNVTVPRRKMENLPKTFTIASSKSNSSSSSSKSASSGDSIATVIPARGRQAKKNTGSGWLFGKFREKPVRPILV